MIHTIRLGLEVLGALCVISTAFLVAVCAASVKRGGTYEEGRD